MAADDKRIVFKPFALAAFPAFIIAGLVVVWIFRGPIYNVFATPERLRDWVAGWGYTAPLVFIGVQFTQVVLFVIPGEVAQIAGGYVFGVWLGVLYSIIGILLGSVFNFYLARLLGVPFVESVFGKERLAKFDAILTSRRATVAFFLFFLIPGVPKDALCYVAGLSTLAFPSFLLVSTIGRLPGIIGSSALGSAAAARSWVLFGSILVAAIILFVIGIVYRDRLQVWVERTFLRRSREEDAPKE